MPRIAHLDMDAFFASVELSHYPELRGQAVVVGGRRAAQPELQADGSRRFSRLADYAGRGVATTATYEARALGVFSGMGLMAAAKLAPSAILLPAQFEAYRDFSRRFKAAVAAIAPKIEDRGIDEIYIDLGGIPEDSLSLAKRLKAAVFEATGLFCSVGIAANKLLAKIASDLDKPDGITILTPDNWQARIWPLPPKKINGVGPKAAARLDAMGIKTIGELAAVPAHELVARFGHSYGAWLSRAAHGQGDETLKTEREPKSASRETTFERDLHAVHDKAELTRQLNALCDRVAEDLARKKFRAHTIGVKLRFADFRQATRELTLPEAVADSQAIRRAVRLCLRRIALERRIRLLGVRCGGLESADGALHGVQSELFLG
jgi:DNA polymerase-4